MGDLFNAVLAIIGWIGLAVALFAGAWLLSKWLGRERMRLPPLAVYGDFPSVPEELRFPSNRKAGGRASVKAGEPVRTQQLNAPVRTQERRV